MYGFKSRIVSGICEMWLFLDIIGYEMDIFFEKSSKTKTVTPIRATVIYYTSLNLITDLHKCLPYTPTFVYMDYNLPG
jgi:hypothetical protein